MTERKKYSFKAETKQLLDILINSLYKNREVFLREMLSNASDALNRLRFEMLTEQEVRDPDAELSIRISVEKDNGLIIVRDTGIGMTKEEIIKNLGTIAQSGARGFVEAVQAENADVSQVIGQFGVGFYSVFMVAESVRVTSLSYKPRTRAVSWFSTGDDEFQVESAEMQGRGTKIEIRLKEDALEFADEQRIKNIIQKHSDYIGFPIYVGEDDNPVNKRTSLWRTPKTELDEAKYKDFYRQLTLDFEDPLLHVHLVTDAPVQLYALLYIPAKSERGIFSLRKEDGLQLYSRNILIDDYNKDLLPEYLRFVQGVVDSEDLPLNVSRETVQAVGLLPKLKKVVTGQVLRALKDLAKKDAEKYNIFWQEFGVYLKQGIASEPNDTEKLHSLLRFRSNLHPETWISLDDYVEGMQEDQKDIYYLVGDDRQSLLRSPHLDQAEGLEVLLLTDPMDSFMLMGLPKFKDFELKNIASTEIDLPKENDNEKVVSIPEDEFNALIKNFKEILGDRVTDVRASKRLSQSVARLVDPEGSLNPEMQRVYKYLGKEYEVPKKILELNSAHPILKKLINADADLKAMVVEQIYDSALLVEGLHPDPSSMTERVQKLMEKALES